MGPVEDASADNAPAGGIPLARAIGTRNLLIIIVTMPLVFLLVVVATIALFGRPGGEPVPDAARTVLPMTSAPLVLTHGQEVAGMALDGDRLVLHLVGPEGAEIVVYDLAAGERLHSLPVRHAAKP